MGKIKIRSKFARAENENPANDSCRLTNHCRNQSILNAKPKPKQKPIRPNRKASAPQRYLAQTQSFPQLTRPKQFRRK